MGPEQWAECALFVGPDAVVEFGDFEHGLKYHPACLDALTLGYARVVETRTIAEGTEAGNRQAWAELIERYQGLVWSVASRYRLGAHTDDVVQVVWLRLFESYDRIHDLNNLAGWLVAVTRREAIQLARKHHRPLVDDTAGTTPGYVASPEEVVVDQDTAAYVLSAFQALPERDQHLLRLLCTVPPLSYVAIAAELGCPIGSIGSYRSRVLGKLRKLLPEIDPTSADSSGSSGGTRTEIEIAGGAAGAIVTASFAEALAQSLLTGVEHATEADLVEIGRRAGERAAAAMTWQSRIGYSIDTNQVTLLLGISRQAIDSRKRTGSILALPSTGTSHYPTWQFDVDGAGATVRPITLRIVNAFREAIPEVSPYTIAAWARSPQPELDGSTPADWIERNGPDEPLVRSAQRTALLEAL